MYQDTNDFTEYREYGDQPAKTNYLHPDYYQSSSAQASPSGQPTPSFDTPSLYRNHDSANSISNDAMHRYRGPASVEGYTTDVGAEQRDAAARGSVEDGGKRKKAAGIGGAIATIGALLLKFGTFLLNLKWLVLLLKFGGAGITALISIVVYSYLFGPSFAVGLVALLFVHEMGHALVMKLKGIPVGGMIFIPMLGAAVTMKQMPRNARDEAEVGIAGPIAGAIASSFCLFMAEGPHALLVWAPLAYFGFFMNLFNLVPVVPFDGGRVLAAIDRRIWIVGFIALLAFFVWQWLNGNFSPWLLFFIFMAATQFWSRRNVPDTPEGQAYYAVPMRTRVILSLLYFGLAAVLVLGMSVAHGLIPLT